MGDFEIVSEPPAIGAFSPQGPSGPPGGSVTGDWPLRGMIPPAVPSGPSQGRTDPLLAKRFEKLRRLADAAVEDSDHNTGWDALSEYLHFLKELDEERDA